MTPTIKRRIARESLIFLVCILIGLSASYFWKYFPPSYRGTHVVYANQQQADLLNAEYHRTGVLPEGYHTGSQMFDPPNKNAIKNAQSMEELQSVLGDIRNWKYDWLHEEPFWRRGTVGELFADLRRDLWLWFYVLSPYLGLCVVRSIICR